MIVLFYNNIKLFDDRTFLSNNIEHNMHLDVKCNNSKILFKMKALMMKTIMVNEIV